MKIEERNYDHLKGIEVKVYEEPNHSKHEGQYTIFFIAGADYKKGFTFLKLDDPSDELCINHEENNAVRYNYKGAFAFLVRKSLKGEFHINELRAIVNWDLRYLNGIPTLFLGMSSACSFS